MSDMPDSRDGCALPEMLVQVLFNAAEDITKAISSCMVSSMDILPASSISGFGMHLLLTCHGSHMLAGCGDQHLQHIGLNILTVHSDEDALSPRPRIRLNAESGNRLPASCQGFK